MIRPRLLAKNALRPLLFVLGCILLVLGIAGLILPLLPGTIFLILAAACFARSSPRFENWLVTHPQFGPSIRAWRKTGAIPRHAKLLAIGAMALSFVFTVLSGAPPVAVICTGCILLACAAYVGTRPS